MTNSDTYYNKLGICPVCNGTCEVPIPERNLRFYPSGRTTMPCRNCGGQTMFGKPTGRVFLDKHTGLPCTHDYEGVQKGRCYTVFTCRNCGHSYDIDSGD